MSKSLSWSVFATTAGLVTGASPVQAQEGFKIENNDSVYIDAQAFKVMPGKAKGDVATQIKSLGARELGQGTIVFRFGEKLYIVEPGTAIVQNARAMPDSTDTRRFVPRDPPYMRFQSPGPAGDGSMAYMRDPAYAQRADVYINNPDFVQYWLKKSFDENWTASDAK